MRATAATLLVLALLGCAGAPSPAPAPPPVPAPAREQSLFLLLPDADGRTGRITVSNAAGAQTLERAGEATAVGDAQTAPGAPAPLDQARIDRLFGEVLAAAPSPPERFTLNFEKDSPELTAASRADIARIVASIRERGSTDTSVVGHTDTLGDEQRNVELSLKRAMAIGDRLVAAGVDPGTLDITSHGEKNLLVPTADNVDEPRNRRVEVTVR